MTAEIKLPPFPEGMCLREDIEDYARAAVEADRAQRVLDADGDSLTIAYLHGFAKGKDAALTASTAHPSPAQKPLTDEQIKDIHWSKPMDEFQFARAIEASHGIGKP